MIGVPAPCQENMKSQASCPLQWSNPPRTTQRTILSHMRHASQSWTTQHPHITLQTRTGRAYLQLITTILDWHRSDHNGSGDGWSFPAVCFSALTSAQSSGFKNNPYHYLSLIGLQNLLRFSNHVGLFLPPPPPIPRYPQRFSGFKLPRPSSAPLFSFFPTSSWERGTILGY